MPGSDLEDFGGVAQFVSLVQRLQHEALEGSGRRGVITVSSGDNFLAGPEFNVSLEKGVPFFDTIGHGPGRLRRNCDRQP